MSAQSKLDPQPFVYQDGERWALPSLTDDEVPDFAPRPEFVQERSAYPESPDLSTGEKS